MCAGQEQPETAIAATDHYYRVYVSGYVFPKLPAGSTEDEIRKAVADAVDDGYLDITSTLVEGAFDD